MSLILVYTFQSIESSFSSVICKWMTSFGWQCEQQSPQQCVVRVRLIAAPSSQQCSIAAEQRRKQSIASRFVQQ